MSEVGIVYLLIFIGLVVWRIIENQQIKRERESIPEFTLKVSIKKPPADHVFAGMDCFCMTVVGWFNNPDRDKMKLIFMAHDNTDRKKGEPNGFPMLCTQSFFCEPNSRVFSVQQIEESKPELYLPKAADYLYIPCEFLISPYKGKRKIQFTAIIGDEDLTPSRSTFDETQRNKIARISTHIIEYNFKEIGYFENILFRDQIDDLTIELALAMAATDGDLDQSELDIIKNWSLLKTFELDEDKQIEKKKHFTDFIKKTYRRAKEKKLSMSKILDDFNDKATKQQKYEAIDLLLQIIAADNKLSKAEDKLLGKIANKFGLDEKIFADMKNKVLATIGSIETTKGSVEDLLGLKKTMSDKEKCKELRKQYSKWNAQTNSSNSKIKERSREMVKVIADLRTKYNC